MLRYRFGETSKNKYLIENEGENKKLRLHHQSYNRNTNNLKKVRVKS